MASLKAKLEEAHATKTQVDLVKDEIQDLHEQLLKSGSSRTHEELKAEYSDLQKKMYVPTIYSTSISSTGKNSVMTLKISIGALEKARIRFKPRTARLEKSKIVYLKRSKSNKRSKC